MASSIAGLHTRVMEKSVDCLSIDNMLNVLDLITNCFPVKNLEIEDLHVYDGVVMLEGSTEYTNFLGFQITQWEPLAVMTVKRLHPGAEGFHAANMCVNLTNVCVRQDLQGQGMGTRMIKTYLDSLLPGNVAFLHVDKKKATSLETPENQAWRDFVLQRVTYLDNGTERSTPDNATSTTDKETQTERWIGLVSWYTSLGFQIHYSNDKEVCLCHYAHMDAVDYDSEDWHSAKSDDDDKCV